jgi:NIPSNAP
VRAPKAYRPISFVTDREHQTIRNAVDRSISAIAGIAIVEGLGSYDRPNIHFDPARKRDAMLGKIYRILGGIEISHVMYIQLDSGAVKQGRGAMCPCPQDSVEFNRYNRPRKNKGGPSMIYETRVYRCVPGRLPALLKRFETITLKLWEKHGIKQAGFFTTLVGESNQELTYLLAWESLAERDKKWNAFQSDPEWITARAKTEEDGPIVGNIVNQLLLPTSFSSVK